ncbi:formyl-CoA transferase [Mycobacterium sp. E342]|uniref:CaiB/BaiF CoA transferase family protein n=1 Tax=unclassified Mycobacterium TaxID=2642494 RepID=UPI0008010C09|nr:MULTISPECIES: CoA transferase [unclassified Mycobacterium]OBH16861.1 formyl-CoA transferase [Mycobacterium sp. E3247]OBH32088.1 formyl-CoA transferase [Mycobacterium sp. E342]
MTDILRGIRVVELAAWTFVPAAGAVLADWGADVIKIEHPETGDPQRGLINSGVVPGSGGVNHFVEQPNRGKRSIGLDTSNPDGLELLMRLLETADVFLTNLLPGSRRRMGVDVEQVRARNPKIIYARGHGYGTKGDMADRGGFDLAAYWARGGIGEAYRTGDGSYPPLQRPAFGDVYGGLAIAGGIAGALVKRERTGEPSVVDVSLLGAAVWQLGPDIVGAGVLGNDIPKFQLDAMPNPVASVYRTRDGRFIAFVLLQADRFWAEFCSRLGRDDLVDDERFATAAARFANRVDCVAELRAAFGTQDLCHWEKAFSGFDGVWDVMHTAHDVHTDPQAVANGYLPRTRDAQGNEFALAASPVQFDETPLRLTRAPGHGEHTDALLAELGFSQEEIIDLKVKAVVL